MSQHISIIAIMAFAAMGMWTAMGDQMILEAWRKVIEKRAPIWAQKMLAICPRCMVTLFGTFVVAMFGIMPEPISQACYHMLTTAPAHWQWECAKQVFDVFGYIICAVGLQELVQR